MRIALLFCIVALACVAQAQPEDVDAQSAQSRASMVQAAKLKLEQAKDKVDELIGKAIDLLKRQIAYAKKTAEKVADSMKSAAQFISDKLYNVIHKVLDTMDSEVGKLKKYAEAEGVDVTECTLLTQTLRETALAVLSNSSYCLVEKIEKGQSIARDIARRSEEALVVVSKVREDANECVNDIDGFKKILAATTCVATTATKASWAVSKQVPAVLLDLSKMTLLITTLPPSLSYCVSKNSVLSVIEESKNVLLSVKNCVSEKIKGATKNDDAYSDFEGTKVPDQTEYPVPSYSEELNLDEELDEIIQFPVEKEKNKKN